MQKIASFFYINDQILNYRGPCTNFISYRFKQICFKINIETIFIADIPIKIVLISEKNIYCFF